MAYIFHVQYWFKSVQYVLLANLDVALSMLIEQLPIESKYNLVP